MQGGWLDKLSKAHASDVETPAINAKNPATIKNTIIAFSQLWSDSPNIALTRFELSALIAIGLELIGFVVLIVVVIYDFTRGRKC